MEQVRRDHALLRVRIERLGGESGTARLEAALNAARAAAAAAATSTPPGGASPMSSPRRPSGIGNTTSASPASSPMREAAQAAALQAGGAGDAGGIATASNETLMWELLYNLEWQMPMAELESLWTDALGETGASRTYSASVVADVEAKRAALCVAGSEIMSCADGGR